jgi:acetyltransferase-like isoleucine patch superfamily enzyme
VSADQAWVPGPPWPAVHHFADLSNLGALTVVADDTELVGDVRIDPFCVIGQDPAGADAVVIGPGSIVRSHSVLYRGGRFGARFHAGHGAQVREHARFGDDVSIGSHAVIQHSVHLGDGVRIHTGTTLGEYTVVEDGGWVGPYVIATNSRRPNQPNSKEELEPVRIGAGAIIGAAVVLLPGVVVGEGAFVGAGAVVSRDVAPGTTVVGNPARVVAPR